MPASCIMVITFSGDPASSTEANGIETALSICPLLYSSVLRTSTTRIAFFLISVLRVSTSIRYERIGCTLCSPFPGSFEEFDFFGFFEVLFSNLGLMIDWDFFFLAEIIGDGVEIKQHIRPWQSWQ